MYQQALRFNVKVKTPYFIAKLVQTISINIIAKIIKMIRISNFWSIKNVVGFGSSH